MGHRSYLDFLIKGHTKNECDAKFNSLKAGTRGVNIFTEAGLDAAYTKENAENIDVKCITGDQWKAWTAGLNMLYKDPAASTIMQNHIFTFGSDSTKTIYTRQIY